MRWPCSFHFRYLTNKIVFTLQVNLATSDCHDFIAILRVSRVSWGKCSELFGCFTAASSEIVKKLKYLQAKLRICRECKDYVIGRETTTELKITVDNAILELCDSCDFSASPLIKWCAVVSTVINESSSTALECALRSSKTPFFSTNSSLNM